MSLTAIALRKSTFLLLMISLAENTYGAESIAGNMTERDICQTSGYLIRQKLGKAFKTIDIPCTVRNIGGNKVEINAGYVSPIGPKTLNYTAHGVVNGSSLRLDDIQVDGIDDKPTPFSDFP